MLLHTPGALVRALAPPLLALLAVACGGGDSGPSRASVEARIACGSAPALALTRATVGEAVPVVSPVPTDADPQHWVPARSVVAELRDARLVVLAGAGLEAWSGTASLPPSRIVDAAAGLEGRWITLPVTRHTHGNGEEHTHEGNDPHTWLDPALLVHALTRVSSAAVAAFPEAEAALVAQRTAALAAADAYRSELVAAAPLVNGRKLLAAWPCYGYLARTLGVRVEVLALDPWAQDGRVPDAVWHKLEAVKGDVAPVLLWPCKPNEAIATRLAQTHGITSIRFDAWLRAEDAARGIEALRAGAAALRSALAPR